MTQPDAANPNSNVPMNIDVRSVDEMLKRASENDSQEFLLIDCREPSEYETCKIEGSVLLPMNSIVDHLDQLESHREKPIVVY